MTHKYLNIVKVQKKKTWIITLKSTVINTKAEVTASSELTWNSLNIVTPWEKAEITLFRGE